MKRHRENRIFCAFFLFQILLTLVKSENENWILTSLPTDHIGHHRVYFSALLPIYQPDLSGDGILIDGSISAANGSYKIDVPEFSIVTDSSRVYSGNSWFNYRQGDYLYKHIIIGREYILPKNTTILIKGFGHTFPGPYGNLGPASGPSKNRNSLQNYNVHYSYNDSLSNDVEVGFLYHLEDSGLPFSIDQHHPQTHESFHSGFKWKKNIARFGITSNLKYQYGKLKNDQTKFEYLTLWEGFQVDYKINNTLSAGIHHTSKNINREYIDSTMIFERGWENLIIKTTLHWKFIKGSVGVNTFDNNLYPDVVFNFQRDHLFLSGLQQTFKYFSNKDNEYHNVNKNQIVVGLFDQKENHKKSITLTCELNRINDVSYYSSTAMLIIDREHEKMNIIGHLFYNPDGYYLRMINGDLEFMPIISAGIFQLFDEIPLIGMIFWNKQKRYFPFIKLAGYYVSDSGNELPLFDIWERVVEYEILQTYQFWINLHIGFTTSNFRFTWSIKNLAKNNVQLTDFTQPLGPVTYFQVDWRFLD